MNCSTKKLWYKGHNVKYGKKKKKNQWNSICFEINNEAVNWMSIAEFLQYNVYYWCHQNKQVQHR